MKQLLLWLNLFKVKVEFNHLIKKKIQELAKFLKENDILLIIDEVQTGVYRTGEF